MQATFKLRAKKARDEASSLYIYIFFYAKKTTKVCFSRKKMFIYIYKYTCGSHLPLSLPPPPLAVPPLPCLPLNDLNNAAFLKFVINGDWSDGLAG